MPLHHVTIEDLIAIEIPDLLTYGQFCALPDGEGLLALAPVGPGRRQLVQIDVATGDERVLVAPSEPRALDLAEELRQERTRQRITGVTGFALLGSDSLLVAEQGAYRVVSRADGAEREGFDLEGLLAAVPFGDGGIVGSTGTEVVLVEEGSRRVLVSVVGDGQRVGVPEYAAAEELDRTEGLWADPAGRFVLYAEVDESNVPPHPIVHFESHPNWVEWHRFPFAGGPNAVVTLCVFDVEASTRRPVATFAEDGYLLGVTWLDSGEALVVSTDRAQRELVRQRLDPTTGIVLDWHREVLDPWLEPPIAHLPRGGDVVTTTVAADGLRRLAVLDAAGTLRVLDEPVIDELIELSPTGEHALVLVPSGPVPATDVALVELATGEFELLGRGEGRPVALWRRGEVVCRRSGLASPPEVVVVGAGHDRKLQAATPTIEAVVPEHIVLRAPTGEDLHALAYLPPEGDPAGAPLVVSVYGGPSVQEVRDAYGVTLDRDAQWLVAHGAVVLKLDNRGSANRDRAFARHLDGRFGAIELEDQVIGVHAALSRYGCDPRRVGIYGWSYGGYLTLMAMLRYPEVFSAGVAGAPVVDWRWYDTAYTERYLGMPDARPESYDASSPLGLLSHLAGRLLVIHGMIDENVHVGHSLAFLHEARQLGKQVESVLVRGSRHGPRSAEDRLVVARARLGFLARHLGLAGDPMV